MADLVGKVLAARYRVDEFVGKGGMAEVYKVWDGERAVFLAAKVLNADLAEDRVFLRRFTREAETLASLQHPHIVRFYGLEEHNSLRFMLMDYVEGTTLRKQIFDAHRPFAAPEILNIMRPVCSALYYAHATGHVHCDIKPANIMVKSNGDVLVADFGIARLMESGTTMTMVGAGTPAYMAPEQVLGRKPSPETDIYALGIVLFEMLTGGERPFTGEYARTDGTTSEKVRWEQVKAAPPSPRRDNPAVSQQLEQVVLTCLQKDPAQRYASALEFLQALESALEAEKITTHFTVPRASIAAPLAEERPVTAAPPARRPRKTRTWAGIAVSLGLLAVVAFAVLLLPTLLTALGSRPPLALPVSTNVNVDLPIAAIAASSATATPMPSGTATLQPTATATATSTMTSTPTPRPLYYTEDFASTPEWTTWQTRGQDYFSTPGWTSWVIRGGRYEVTPVPADEQNWTISTSGGGLTFVNNNTASTVYFVKPAPVYDEVDVELTVLNQASPNVQIGLICHYSGTGWYEVRLTPNTGDWEIAAVDMAGVLSRGTHHDIVNGTTAHVNLGPVANTYKFGCGRYPGRSGLVLRFWINNLLTIKGNYTEHNYQLPEGGIGISISSLGAGPVSLKIESITVSTASGYTVTPRP